MLTFILIALKNPNENALLDYLKKLKEVKRAHAIFGEWDVLAEVEVRDQAELGTFVIDKIRSQPDVRLTSSLIVAR